MAFVSRIAWILLLLFVAVVPVVFTGSADVRAQTPIAVAELSPGFFLALENSYQQFRQTGSGSYVELAVPLPEKIITARLRPHALGLKPTNRYPQARLFAGSFLTSRSDDFLRIALLSSSATARPTVEGLVSVDGALYRLSTSPDSTNELQIRPIDPDELSALLAACASQVAHAESGGSFLADFTARAGDGSSRMSMLKEIEVATEADFEFVSGAGGARSANAYILAILNSVDGLYRAQLGLTIKVVYQNTWAVANDPYTESNPEALLSQFFSYWQSNFRSRLRYDVAHLFTGRMLEYGVIGVAYTSSACQFQSYSLSRVMGSSGMDVPLAAHEIAHTLGSVHDACNSGESFIMCPVIISGATNFSGRSLFDIATYVGAVSCLRETSTPSGNRYPDLAPIGPRVLNENQILIIAPIATDPEGGLITLSATGMPPGASFDGTRFEYQPAFDAVTGGRTSKDFAVTFTARDTGGLTDSETVVITVQNVNRAPRSTGDRILTVAEGNLASTILDAFDPDNDTLAFYPSAPLPRGLSVDPATGRVSWRPGGEQSGVQHLHFQVVDPFGAADHVGLQINIIENGTIPPLRSQAVANDFDGDGRSDLTVFRGQSGTWFTINLGASTLRSFQFGLPGDVPVPGDYNGDGIFDAAVFRPTDSRWYIRNSGSLALTTFAFGLPGDLPFSGDLDGDGRSDIAIYRPNPGIIVYLDSTDLRSNIVSNLGGPGFVPLSGNIDTLAGDETVLFREGQFLSKGGAGVTSFALGQSIALPSAGDFNGDGRIDITAYDPGNGVWTVTGGAQSAFGSPGDLPVVGDFDGDGRADRAVWRPTLAHWFVQLASGTIRDQQFGLPGDQLPQLEQVLYGLRNSRGKTIQAGTAARIGVDLLTSRNVELLTLGLDGLARKSFAAPAGSFVLRGDYDGDGASDTAVFRNGVWNLSHGNGTTRVTYWGVAGDEPVSADFDGDGKTDVAIWRPTGSNGVAQWFIIRSGDGGVEVYDWGLKDDRPLPADFNGDGRADPAVFRDSMGTWFPLDSRSRQAISPQQWGLPGDQLRTADLDRDGRSDMIVWRPSSGSWYTKLSGGGAVAQQWGLPGDVPVVGPFSATTASEYAVYRPRTRQLFVLTVSGPRVVSLGAIGAQGANSVVGVAPFAIVN